MRPVLAVDFDGTITEYKNRWEGPEKINEVPVPGAQEFIRKAQEHFDVVVFSTRATFGHRAMDAMKDWLRENGFPDLDIVSEKPPAAVFLDDRAVRFEGTYPDPKALLALRSWYEN